MDGELGLVGGGDVEGGMGEGVWGGMCVHISAF